MGTNGLIKAIIEMPHCQGSLKRKINFLKLLLRFLRKLLRFVVKYPNFYAAAVFPFSVF